MAVLNRCGRAPSSATYLLCLFAALSPAHHSAAAFQASAHPRLFLAEDEIRSIKGGWVQSTLFAAAIDRARARIEPLVLNPPNVPAPKDPGGGYTHERHKANGIVLAQAGALFRWTGEAAYADLARRLLLEYAEMYPQLGPHPERKGQAPGRLFWQSLNESVWLTYAIQGYDAVHDALGARQRERIETRLLRPMARFLSVESARVFNSIHNHGTWAAAAVGMTGYVLDDEELVEAALMGTGRDGKAGFLAQLGQLFSPDGYYLEGPYYQRYALMPFVLFAKAIARNEPERAIFAYRDGIILKAIRTTIQLTYSGRFFPVNDAIRDKGLDTAELDHAIAIGYGATGDPSFVSLVDDRAELVLTADGLRLALAKEAKREAPFPFASRHFRDGARGDQGALTVLRAGPGPQDSALVFKATSHGMGHGHFDRLHWMFYDNGAEIVADYGAARFLNVAQKDGGRYLPENRTWAKQTVAHNTLVVDAASQFGANVQLASRSWPTRHYWRAGEGVQVVSASETNAYPGTMLRRTMLLLERTGFDYPLVVDLLQARAQGPRRFDLPLYFKGDLIEASPRLAAAESLRPMGANSGYQHLWRLGGTRAPANEKVALTWLKNNRFYTYSVVANVDLEVMHTRVGAGDPEFSLRPEPGFLLRADQVRELNIVALLEPHGEYNGAREYTIRSRSQVARIKRFGANGKDLVEIETTGARRLAVALSHDPRPSKGHTITADTDSYQWRGFHGVFLR